MRSRRVLGLSLAALLPLAALTACGGDDDPDPDVTALTKAFATGDFTAVSFAGDETAEGVETDYERITKGLVDGLGGEKPKVTASDPSVTGTTAESTLSWTWPVPGDSWTYTSLVELTKAGDDWKVKWSPTVVSPQLKDARSRLDTASIVPERGDIIGTNGVRLVTDRPVVSYGIDKTQVPPARAVQSARELAALLDIDPSSYAKQVKASGPKAFVEAITYRRGQAPAAAAGIGRIKGAVAIQTSRALGITKEFAAPILGTVGDVTAEMIKEHPDLYKVGDTAGLSGLEARYDERLRGVPGTEIDLVGADGKVAKQLFQAPPQDGRPLTVTLDDRLQSLAESVLADVRPASALVAIRPSTGAILAAANGPGNNGVNLATYGQAQPGSTFKTIDSLALLRKGLTPSTTVQCPPTITVDGKEFGNDTWYPSSALGSVPLSLAIAQSCNTAMIGQHDRLSQADLTSAAATLGFGVDHDTGFSSYFGQIPEASSETEHAADLIGQGKVLASPMVMATVMASIEAGHTVVPKMVVGQGETQVPDGTKPLTKQEAQQMRTLFRGVVTEGTGRGLLDVPGKPVIAKTGTAEFDRDGKRLTHTWMIAAQGDLAVAVYVDEGLNGSSTAGPLVEQFLRGA
ncbi:penicillin-binding transpeptidase domain-containing protein [Nocardioides cheoyonin]|uniref:penicillin-binding transpeptidase domain-containing protein n=1 Tax=Nocardioides cheoyonin TaxID=3156615 RepID=UPI0032B537A5